MNYAFLKNVLIVLVVVTVLSKEVVANARSMRYKKTRAQTATQYLTRERHH